MFKLLVKKIMIKVITIKSNVKLDFKSDISKQAIKTLIKNKTNSNYPIIVTNSYLDEINMEEGCRISNSSCSGKLNIGRFVSINGPGTRISCRLNSINIGSFSSIASNVIIQEDYHNYNRPTSYFIMKNIFKDNINKDIFTKGSINIEEDVWVGSNTVILSGVTVGRGAIIGAGSVVTKDIPKYAIACGNPAKIVKYRFDNETIDKLEDLKWWEWSIEEIKNNKVFFETNLNL